MAFHSYGQISVYPGQSAIALAQKLVGQGVMVSNPTLTCPTQAQGFFVASKATIRLDSGIVLTTGTAKTGGGRIGVNGFAPDFASADNRTLGDTALERLAGQRTYDACNLEFDVVPTGDSISIGYIFSSEEYKSAVCGSYNDAFAFFISGPGYAVPTNIAKVPGTNIPVSINSINNGIPGSSGSLANCTAMGPGSPFTSLYVDNTSGSTLTHRGCTKVLKASCAVVPCARYHLKIVVADAGNATYDSGVFLEAGSLKSNSYNLLSIPSTPLDTLDDLIVKGCKNGLLRVKSQKRQNTSTTLKLMKSGSAVAGIDYIPLPDSITIRANDTSVDVPVVGLPTPLNGPKTLHIELLSPKNCSGMELVIDSATLYIYDSLSIIPDSLPFRKCLHDSIVLRLSNPTFYKYTWWPDVYISDIHAAAPVVYTPLAMNYRVEVSLPGSRCPTKQLEIPIVIKQTPNVLPINDTTICFGDSVNIGATVLNASLQDSYYWLGAQGMSGSNRTLHIDAATDAYAGIYTIKVTNDTNGCSSSSSFELSINQPDTVSVHSQLVYCLHQPYNGVRFNTNFVQWYTAPGSSPLSVPPIINTSAEGQYSYWVTQASGLCNSRPIPINIEVKKCCDGYISVPNAFTPNQDGYNDVFRPLFSYGYFVKQMYIFNRYGETVYNGNVAVWDGSTNQVPAPSGVYFYRILFGCLIGGSEERVGDVTLIR